MKADFGSAPTYLIIGGAVLGAAGIALGIVTQDSTGPENVLCIQPGAQTVTPPRPSEQDPI